MSQSNVVHGPAWHYSYWPFILSVGILVFIPLSFIFHFVYHKELLSILSLGVGAVITFIGIAGWVCEGFADEHGYGQGLSVWAMPLFIIAEALLFIGFFAAYWVLRLKSDSWPPAGTPHMPFNIPIIMTILLVSSSFTIHAGEKRVEDDDTGGAALWLFVTMLLGAAFLCLSGYEWSVLMAEGFTPKTNVYSTAFFSITGFHGSHVLVGLGMFACFFIPAVFGRNANKAFFKAASMYWHFVDIVWLFVVSQMYFW